MSTPRIASTKIETAYGEFDFYCFSWSEHEEDNILCLIKAPTKSGPILCRIQSACYTSEIFRSLDCDCHEQLHTSLSRIQNEDGVLIYTLRDGRGAGLFVKTQGLALGLSEKLDTSDAYRRLGVPQDPREYTRAAFSLQHLGITHIKLLTNNPRKITGIEECGITVEREPLEIQATSKSKEYLSTKARKMGHLLAQFSSEQ